MAKTKRNDALFDHLRARGVRKRVANAVAKGGGKGRKKGDSLTRSAIKDLRSAADSIKHGIGGRDSKRSKAAKKAARTRKAEKERRSRAARKAARTRARAASR
jgi:hypothetical protein